MSFRTRLLAATLLTVPVALQAQAQSSATYAAPTYVAPMQNLGIVDGFYIGAGVGANWAEKTKLKQSGSLSQRLQAAGYPANNGTAKYDAGILALGSAGYGFGNGLRVEGEFDYRENRVNQVAGFGRAGAGINTAVNNKKGTRSTYGLMFNALYDFDIPSATWIVPYVGAGIGVAWTQWSHDAFNYYPTNALLNPASFSINNTQAAFAYQAIAGVGFPIESYPGLAVTLEYRFFGTVQNKFTGTITDATNGRLIASGSVKSNNINNAIMLGIRYNFGREPAPVVIPAAVAPAAARTYLVFFDWNRADLTERARQIIAEAASASKSTTTTRIDVAGHADRSGSDAYNQKLSERRAEAVAAELVRRGVPRTEIGITAYGESRPLVPTADGVREPQNRRVEIVLR